jgi:IS1 family transposase
MSWNWIKSGHLYFAAADSTMPENAAEIIAAVMGDRSTKTCRRLWELIPECYRRCHIYSDFWSAYSKIFDVETHRLVGKEKRWERPFIWSSGITRCASALLGA